MSEERIRDELQPLAKYIFDPPGYIRMARTLAEERNIRIWNEDGTITQEMIDLIKECETNDG